MNRNNLLFLLVGVLIVAVAALGYQNYQDRKQPEGVQITVGPNGLTVEKK